MPNIPLTLATKSNPGRDPQEGAAKLINCYAEITGQDAKGQTAIHACNGFTEFSTLASGGAVRAMLAVGAYLYVVAGRVLYRVDSTGTSQVIGGIPTDGPVYMGRNRREPSPEIGIVSDGLFWVCTDASLAEVIDADLPEATSFAVLDGYGILPGHGNRWFITGIDDFTAIDGLDFAKTEASPDATKRILARGPELVFLGERSIEFWQDTAQGDFPFSRAAAISFGCFAPGSAVNATIVQGNSVLDALIWAGTDNEGAYAGVMMATGYQPNKISDYWVDRAIRDEPDASSIRGTSWNADGHTFYSISGTSFTACWDSQTGWHHRQSYGLSRWRIAHVTSFAGMVIGGDYDNGKLYQLSPTVYDEDGEPLVMTVQAPPVHGFPQRFRHDALYIDAVLGVGDGGTSEDTGTPHLMLSWADDGLEFGTERLLHLGQQGARTGRIKTTRLGRVTGSRTYRFSVSAAVFRSIMGASVDVTSLGS